MLTSDVRWFEGASSSGGTGPSTSGAPPADSDSLYICEDWVYGISTKKLRFISHEYRLGHLARWTAGNERSYLPPCGYMTFSETILKTGVFLPLHPFIAQVLDYFDIVPFQLPPNSIALLWRFTSFSQSFAVLRLQLFTSHLYTGSRPLLNIRDFGT